MRENQQEMWNHQNHNPKPNQFRSYLQTSVMDRNGTQEMSYEDKVRKALDLKPYLSYLTELFAQNPSDSDSSEAETEGQPINFNPQPPLEPKVEEIKYPAISQAIHTLNLNLNESSSSSSKSGFKLEPLGGVPGSVAPSTSSVLPLSSPFSTNSSDYSSSLLGFSSSDSSHDEDEGDGDHKDSELTPISDLELNKFLDKPTQALDSPEDILSLLNSSQDCKSKFKNKIKKRRHKLLGIPGQIPSLGTSKSDDSSLDQSKSQLFTQLCTPPTSHDESINAAAPSSDIHENLDVKQSQESIVQIKVEPGHLLEDRPEDFRGCIRQDNEVDQTNLNLTAELGLEYEEDEDETEMQSENDDDSLSEYMNITANTAISLDPYFKFDTDEMTQSPASSVNAPSSSAHSTSNLPGGEEERKDKSSSSNESLVSKIRRSSPQKQAKLVEMMNLKRKRLYIHMCRKDIGKTQRARSSTHKEMLVVKRRLAQACSRHLRQQAIQCQKIVKESVWRAKRLTREMQSYWKQTDRAEREIRKRKEREAEEKRKMDMELMEAKRQQRKLNFLITQTEIYAHFMSKKLEAVTNAGDDGKSESAIMNLLNEDSTTQRLTALDDDDQDSEQIKLQVRTNVENALKIQESQAKQFSCGPKVLKKFKDDLKLESESNESDSIQQPRMFVGTLKHYQLQGINWLVNLYNQGINGILADEMGLGKTVQAIAFLAHISESCEIWGPFLIVAPTSTLFNWQQEFQRFVPGFTIVPYWGNPQERKILRQCWNETSIHTKETSFHVIITSYQIAVADLKYFNRVKWQYLILDEAQAIKSTTSARWKSLMSFNCRNRLLLTGTPIQNTMAELWALLHFIMPSLFDAHAEFNEWFSKDIESHAENRSFISEKHLCRLRMILKPFMLRRIKKDVENELSDKIEILKYCPLVSRQNHLYTAIKKKIRIEDLIKSSASSNVAVHETTNLMNLVMQFRKVCNHPDLFEKRDVQSPFFMRRTTDIYSKLLYREGLLRLSLPSKLRLLENELSIFNPVHTYESLFRRKKPQCVHIEDVRVCESSVKSEWSWMRFSDLSSAELNEIVYGGILAKWKHILQAYRKQEQLHRSRQWKENSSSSSIYLGNSDFLLDCDRVTSFSNINQSEVLQNLVFLSYESPVYALLDQTIYSIPETIEHRRLRSRKIQPATFEDPNPPLLPEFPHTIKKPVTQYLIPTNLPTFLCQLCPRVTSAGREPHFYDPSAYSWLNAHQLCSSPQGLSFVTWGTPEKPEFNHFSHVKPGGIVAVRPEQGWSRLVIPDKEKLINDSGKLRALDDLLRNLKAEGHRVLIYSQMTKMINILEEFLSHRKWTYIRLDGSSKISDRRDMVADFQSKPEIFVFLLSTRAGGLGINLTAADTVIFYDSDWNPTVDQQAMDRAHRLGQTKQVTVYRLICKGTIEDRILQRAKEKNEIQRMVISGESFKSDTLNPKEVVSLLLDDEELETKYRQKQAERKAVDDTRSAGTRGLGTKRKLPPKNYTDKGTPTPVVKKHKTIETLQQEELGSRSSIESSLPESRDVSPCQSQSETLEEFETETEEFGSENEYDEEMNVSDSEGLVQDFDCVDGGPSTSTRMIEWTADTASDYDEFCVIPKRPKLGRGTGKRGRPPSRVRVITRESEDGMRRRGRPRTKPIGPANQGTRGRRPGRPPLTKKADSLSSSLTPLTTSQSIFGFYSSPDLDAP